MLEPDAIYHLSYLSSPQLNSDGSRVAFVKEFADQRTDSRYSHIGMCDVDGGNLAFLSKGLVHQSQPSWVGDKLAYVSKVDTTWQLIVAGQVVYGCDQKIESFSLSPQGDKVAFCRFVGKPTEWIEHSLYRVDKRGYIPDGNIHLFVVDIATEKVTTLSTKEVNLGPLPWGSLPPPVWSDKGIICSVAGTERLDMRDRQLCEFSFHAPPKFLTPAGFAAFAPTYNDGTIAFTGHPLERQFYQVHHLYTLDYSSGKITCQTEALDRTCAHPQFDGEEIAFIYDDHGMTYLHKGEVIASGLGGNSQAYGGWAGGASYSIKNGTYVYNYSDSKTPSTLKCGNQVIYDPNADYLKGKTLAACTEYRFQSQDGLDIQGWYLTPPDFDKSKKYPLIMDLHGGPSCHFGPRFDIEKQLWARRGYVVAYINYRGSTSYGQEFASKLHHNFPGDELKDIDPGVDALVAEGFIDQDNLFIGGASAGGVLTCWVVGHSTRFKAAAAQYPIVDWASCLFTTDIAEFFLKYWFEGPPWECREEFIRRSPLSYVQHVVTPTMLITGIDDHRTPIEESDKFYRALKMLKVDTALVRVPDEPHGIRKKPSHHVKKIKTIGDWFDRYRKQAD